MLRLSKKVEYGLVSLQYLALRNEDLISAKEISINLNISFEFLSKTMQSLMKFGLVKSQQGIRGGYSLTKPPSEITIAEILSALDEKTNIVDCSSSIGLEGNLCVRSNGCSIKNPIQKLQDKIDDIFLATTLEELSMESPCSKVEKITSNNFI